MAESAPDSRAQTVLPAELFDDLDRSGSVPLYAQIAGRIESAIGTRLLGPGSRLENEISMSERLGYSRPTIRRAIQDLVNKGLLVRRRSLGTQVVERTFTRRAEMTSLFDELDRAGEHPQTRVVAHERIAADESMASVLSVPVGTPLLHLRRVRSTGGVPLAVLDNHLSLDYSDLSIEQLESTGLYRLLRERGASMSVAHQRIGARAAVAHERELLRLRSARPVLTMERIAYGNDGRPMEYGCHCYRPDRYSFEITLVDS